MAAVVRSPQLPLNQECGTAAYARGLKAKGVLDVFEQANLSHRFTAEP
jgi:hypothetical protein